VGSAGRPCRGMEKRPVKGVHLTLQPRLEALISSLYSSTPSATPTQGYSAIPNNRRIDFVRDALFSQSIHLLTLLNNPLNVELLTRHILQSPAIWAPASRRPAQRYARIVAGFHSAVGWKLTDWNEGEGGLSVDEWILAIGRGATGSSMLHQLDGVDYSIAMEASLALFGVKVGFEGRCPSID